MNLGGLVSSYKHLNNLIKETTSDIENFKFHRALEKLYESFWHNFCDEYIEAAKNRLKNPPDINEGDTSMCRLPTKNNASDDTDRRLQETKQTLLYCLKTYLKLLHPFIPFITEEIWEQIPLINESLRRTKITVRLHSPAGLWSQRRKTKATIRIVAFK